MGKSRWNRGEGEEGLRLGWTGSCGSRAESSDERKNLQGNQEEPSFSYQVRDPLSGLEMSGKRAGCAFGAARRVVAN